MGEYVKTDETASYEVGKRDGRILAACVCGSGGSVIDKGSGRAFVASWKTRHQDCAHKADQ